MQITSKIYTWNGKDRVLMKDARVLGDVIYGGEKPIEYWEKLLKNIS